MDTLAQKTVDALLSVAGSMLGNVLSSPMGLLMLLVGGGLIVFPMARSVWRTSRWLFAGLAVLLLAAGLFRPALPKAGPASGSTNGAAVPAPTAGPVPAAAPFPAAPSSHAVLALNQCAKVKCSYCKHIFMVIGTGSASETTCLRCNARLNIDDAENVYKTYLAAYPPPRKGESFSSKCPKCGTCETYTGDGESLSLDCGTCKERLLVADGIEAHKGCTKQHYTFKVFDAKEYERSQNHKGMRQGPDGTWHVRRDDEAPSPADF